MSKVVFIYKKKRSDPAWSSSVSDLGDYIEENIDSSSVLTVDNSTLQTLREAHKSLKDLKLQRNDIICINHAITWWLLMPLLLQLKKKGVKVVFLFHEHEHILGLRYCLTNFKKIKIKEYLRHFKWWYKIPYSLSTKVLCLSSYQGVSLAKLKFERLSYLGVQQDRFPKKQNNIPLKEKIKILFAHDPERYDKGDRFCKSFKENAEIDLHYGREQILDYDKVYQKYHNADIVFLPSDGESYSLVLAEALATNSCIISNTNVGIIQLLVSIYSIDELAQYGLFIADHDQSSYSDAFYQAKEFLNNDEVTTIKLFELLALDQNSSFVRFKNFLKRVSTQHV